MVNKRQISLIRNLITVGTILLFASFLWIKDMGVYFETNDDRIIAEILSGVHSLTQDPHTIHENYLLMLPLYCIKLLPECHGMGGACFCAMQQRGL
mgnify:CR=1 FL=1